MTIAEMIIQRARIQAAELNYSFEEALGDVYGSILWELDSALYPGDRLPEDGLFRQRAMYQINSWFRQRAAPPFKSRT